MRHTPRAAQSGLDGMADVPSPTLSIIVPCFNEAANLPELVARLHKTYAKLGIACETILVDDASRDETLAVMHELARRHGGIRVLAHENNRGLFAGWRTGLAVAQGEYVGVIDADLQYAPEDLGRLWERLHWAHCDVAQGVRLNVTGERGLRFWMSRGLNALLNLIFRMSLHDNKSGFFITRRETAGDMLQFATRYFYPQTFVMVAAHAKGYSIGEVRTVFARREQGQSFMPRFPLGVAARSLVDIGRALPEFRWRRPKLTFLGQKLEAAPPARAPQPRPAARAAALGTYLQLMPLHHWVISADAGKYFTQLEHSQWMTPKQIREMQNERLQLIVSHAYNHVPFYRRRFDEAGIRPAAVASIADLAALPPLTKDDIRAHVHFDLLAENAHLPDLYQVRTSGSTGAPLLCYVDRTQLELRWASTLRSQEWTGYRFGDRTVRLWHQTIGMNRTQIVKEKLDAWLCRRLFIPAFRMTAKNLDDIVGQIVRHAPTMIDGYAESFNLLAQFLDHHPIHCPSLKGLMSSAQTLSNGSRRIIERTFQCGVFDKYGAREFSGIAYECERHSGYHVVAESYIVEIVKNGRPAQPGEVGEVLVTDLNNRCMPFLRYQLGDLARPADSASCACGRGLPLIGEIMGRTQSIVIGTEGQFLPGAFFAHLLKDYDYAVKQFQVYQERFGAIELRIVKGGRFSHSVLDQVLAQLHDYLGRDLVIDVKFLESLPLVRTGKFQHSVSNLRFDFQALAVAPVDAAAAAPRAGRAEGAGD
jgi:phenylacetate-CoA ligase